MKRLLYIVIIIALPVIAYFQYVNWTKFNPPNSYDYVQSDSVDINYYDQQALTLYYQNSYEIGAFARRMWKNEGIDVLFPSESEKSLKAASHFNNLRAVTKQLEKQLNYSYTLKNQGYNNLEIKEITETGISATEYERRKQMQDMLTTQFGDISSNVWKLQQKLNEKGYDTPVDGNFRIDTQVTLQTFQTDNGLFPSGTLDEETYSKLF